jgi:hypothetical protein
MFLYRASLLDNVRATRDRSQVTGDRYRVVIRKGLPIDVHAVKGTRLAGLLALTTCICGIPVIKSFFGDQ